MNEDIKRALFDAKNLAMGNTIKARIPECGDFGAIAQNLDYVCNNINQLDPNWDVSKEVLADFQIENTKLKAKLQEREARIARLEEEATLVIKRGLSYKLESSDVEELQDVLNETPQQSLADIEGDISNKVVKHFCYSLPIKGDIITRAEIERYLGQYLVQGLFREQLRNSVKDGEE